MAVLRGCGIAFPGYLLLCPFRCTCYLFLIFPSGCLRTAVLRDCSIAFPGYLHLYQFICTLFAPHLSFWMPRDGCAPWLWHCISCVATYINLDAHYLLLIFPSGCLVMVVLRGCDIAFPGYLHLYQFICTLFAPHLSFWMPRDGCAPWLWHCISCVATYINLDAHYLLLIFPSGCLVMVVLRGCDIAFPGFLHLCPFRCTCICSSSFLLDASGWLSSVAVTLHFLGTLTYSFASVFIALKGQSL